MLVFLISVLGDAGIILKVWYFFYLYAFLVVLFLFNDMILSLAAWLDSTFLSQNRWIVLSSNLANYFFQIHENAYASDFHHCFSPSSNLSGKHLHWVE